MHSKLFYGTSGEEVRELLLDEQNDEESQLRVDMTFCRMKIVEYNKLIAKAIGKSQAANAKSMDAIGEREEL
ncbi:MAG: hypothetical protein LBC41_00920 [Clostridiales bacterium]|nr:hypothetical protein [Clostridiales bacterium]MDR2749196.1 hypothetical protein [Clostridiales bacterium]